MNKELVQYLKDSLKQSFYKRITGLNKKTKTGMQNVLLQLKVKDLLPSHIKAVELFGMHGLWHTLDYVDITDSLDMFEINKRYLELSKIKLKKYNVKYFNQDSIKFINETNQKYNFIVADIPFGGNFYESSGLPYFFSDFIRIADDSSVIIFNCHSQKLKDFKTLVSQITRQVSPREIKDLFFVPKNELIGYIVLVLN